MGNLRAALDWTFSPEGEGSIGVRLSATAVPPWMHMSLLGFFRQAVRASNALFLELRTATSLARLARDRAA